jgi:hypothetical protein
VAAKIQSSYYTCGEISMCVSVRKHYEFCLPIAFEHASNICSSYPTLLCILKLKYNISIVRYY